MKSNKFNLISAVLLVFFLGAAIGAMGTHIYVKHKFDRIKEKGLAPELVPRLMKKLSRELDLSPEQHSEIHELASQMHTEISMFKEKYHPELEKIVEKYIVLTKEKLNPEQQAQMDKLYGRLKKRWLKPGWFGRHGKHDKKRKYILYLKKKLNLSKDQQQELESVIKEFYKNKADEKQRFAKDRYRLKKEIESKLENILTSEQMEIYKTLKDKR